MATVAEPYLRKLINKKNLIDTDYFKLHCFFFFLNQIMFE